MCIYIRQPEGGKSHVVQYNKKRPPPPHTHKQIYILLSIKIKLPQKNYDIAKAQRLLKPKKEEISIKYHSFGIVFLALKASPFPLCPQKPTSV